MLTILICTLPIASHIYITINKHWLKYGYIVDIVIHVYKIIILVWCCTTMHVLSYCYKLNSIYFIQMCVHVCTCSCIMLLHTCICILMAVCVHVCVCTCVCRHGSVYIPMYTQLVKTYYTCIFNIHLKINVFLWEILHCLHVWNGVCD